MEDLIVIDKVLETSWESLSIIGGIVLAVIIWMVVSRDSSDGK